MKTIVVGLDFSDASKSVLNKAAELAEALGASLRLVHILEPQPSYSTYGFTTEEFPMIQGFQNEARKHAERRLDEAAEVLRGRGYDVATQIAVGSPTSEMESILENLEGAMLVVGTHGHNLVGSILLGSFAEAMVRKAVVPTLVVPIKNKS